MLSTGIRLLAKVQHGLPRYSSHLGRRFQMQRQQEYECMLLGTVYKAENHDAGFPPWTRWGISNPWIIVLTETSRFS